MRRIASIISLIFVLSFYHVIAQDNAIVLKIGKENVSLSEFKNTYIKNNDLSKSTEKDLLEYIDLYINFRLRYAEALELRLDTIEKLQKELEGYRTQAAKGYLTDKEVDDKLLDEAMQRMQWDLRVSHIMKKLSLEAKPEDTLKAYKEIMQLRKRILDGEPFNAVAEKESDDPSARDFKTSEGVVRQRGNKGDLGYFSVFNMIYSFESGAYNLKVGEISMPIRTEFGYHILYLQDKKPALGRCAISQILISYPANASKEDSIKTKNKAQEAYKAVKEGMDFTKAVEMYCTDKGIVSRKGELPLFAVNDYIGDFIQHMYNLKLNEVSEPFETIYGFHIVKLTKRIPIEINAETRAIVRNRIMKDTRSNKSKEAFANKLKKEYGFKEYKEKNKFPALEAFYKIDSSIFEGKWEAKSVAQWEKPLFKIADKIYTQKDFAQYLEQNQYEINMELSEIITYFYKDFVQQTVIDYEDSQLETKHPEFANLMKEYKEGVLLYELNEQKVWRKAEQDTIGLKEFYATIQNNYLYDVRLNANVYTAKDQSSCNKFLKLLKKGTLPQQAMQKLNKKQELITLENVLLERAENKKFDEIFSWDNWKEDINKAKNGENVKPQADELKQFLDKYPLNASLQIVLPVEFLAPSPKPLEEVKGMIVSQYQNYLEEEWIKDLRTNNKIWVDKEAILSLIKNK